MKYLLASLRVLLAVTLGAFVALALPSMAHAQDVPQISSTMKKMLGALPLADMKDDVQALVPALKKTQCGGGLKGCYFTKSGILQLYYFTDGKLQETFLLVDRLRVGDRQDARRRAGHRARQLLQRVVAGVRGGRATGGACQSERLHQAHRAALTPFQEGCIP